MSGKRLTLVIGPSEKLCARLRAAGEAQAEALAALDLAVVGWNHVRLYAACAAPDQVGLLRHNRGLDTVLVQESLRHEMTALLAEAAAAPGPGHLIFCASQLGSLLCQPSELARLRDLLAPHFARIEVVIHAEEQARALVAHYAYALMEGRRAPLSQELALASAPDWWQAALAAREAPQPHLGLFNDIQAPPFWLDLAGLRRLWAGTFGAENVRFRPLDMAALCSERAAGELLALSGRAGEIGPVEAARPFRPEPAPSLARIRQLNELVIAYCARHEREVPRAFWQQMRMSVRIEGPPLAPGALAVLSQRFAPDNAALVADFPDLAEALRPDPPEAPWEEANPRFGYRASQVLAAHLHGLRRAARPLAELRAEEAAAQRAAQRFDRLLPEGTGEALRTRVKVNHRMVLSTRFRPHNDLGAVAEEAPAPPYAPAPRRRLGPGVGGRVIVACMKNEAPYILEWIGYHRAIGVDHFLIYTNDCTDGTDAILARLMEMGIVEHRNNDLWRGNSPQQHALNQALKEPLVQGADWIIHIDVDEFINVRCGNGTLDDFFARVPEATNVAMTWRLFGHNGVRHLEDRPVIAQFDRCAPKFCPKPHTVWGFKTMFRNIGAYGKLSCHRPNRLDPALADRVRWVNGSGRDMTADALKNGWRSSQANVGYDLIQLNHYALRSAESFLIKRQRGRALHVDRSIGLNYWIRMDWSDVRDITIQRNLPRLAAEMDRLMADPALSAAHRAGFDWHRAKAAELRAEPEFRALYEQALGVELNETERVAYALALDMES